VFRAPILLITAGAWGNILAEQFGDTTPLVPQGPTMSVTEPVPYSIVPCVAVISPIQAESAYFRQIPRGNIIIGGGARATAYPDRYRVYVDPQNTLRQLRQIRRLAPALARLNIIRVWSGIEGYLPDDLPVMCASDRVSGLYYAYGFSGQGFQLGPAVGEVMAELIDTGATSTPLDGFEMSRFRSSGNNGRRQA
jgi:sarcosine oxidase subunit beta